jgi:DEAD/DEAH box helicase domain-containing protein
MIPTGLNLPANWIQKDCRKYNGKDPVYGDLNSIGCDDLVDYFSGKYPLYSHQVEALSRFVNGNNVCLSTGTASGKTVLFHGAHIRVRAEMAHSKKTASLAIYPMKSLGFEQEQRWREAFPDQIVGRIDGDVQGMERERLLRTADILITTPDVWHASLLSKLNEKSVSSFLKRMGLLVIDEAHSYTGVFGSNSAFLFRRLQHAVSYYSGLTLSIVAASATLKNPNQHLRNLTGVDFEIIDAEYDGAPKQSLIHHFVQPAEGYDLMKVLPSLLESLVKQNKRFLAFADSRKQVELISDIVNRGNGSDYDNSDFKEELSSYGVLPYRSGYEKEDREYIQLRLQDPSLRGVVATSAMELGLDIPNLDTVVLIGVPNSSTSLHQRIGRVGRNKPGEVVVVYSGSIVDQYVWEDTARFLTRPFQESNLYLGNRRIQYIHAMCLARNGGENESLTGSSEFPIQEDLANWPDGFLELCDLERTGQIDAELESMKGEAGDEPHRRFPLRSCETQFKICFNDMNLGQVGYSQALREAYPGGVYRHLMNAYRVYNVNISSKQILVRKEKRYTTTPSQIPVKVMPNLQPGRLRRAFSKGETVILESDAQIREAICGFREHRGQTEIVVNYPNLEQVSGARWPHPVFSHQFGSSGIVIFHPALNEEKVECGLIANLLLESLLIAQPVERNDLGCAFGKLDVSFMELKGNRFVSIFDSTNGSLRLSSRFLEGSTIDDALTILKDIAQEQNLRPETTRCINALAGSVSCQRKDLLVPNLDSQAEAAIVILPGSAGWSLPHGRQEFVVDAVFYHPSDGLKYKGHMKSWELSKDPAAKMNLPISCVEIIQGESITGYYDFESGEITPI